MKADDTVAPVNNFLSSLFEHVSVDLNNHTVTTPNNSYHYRSYLETLLNFGSDSKGGHLGAGLFFVDEPGKFEDVTSTGFETRKKFLSDGLLELSSYLHLDITNQEKCLLNGVSSRFTFYRSKSNFSLMTASTDKNSYRIDILDAVLLVRMLNVSPSIMIAHERTISKNNAKYPINRIEVKKITLSKDTQSKTLDNIFIGNFYTKLFF